MKTQDTQYVAQVRDDYDLLEPGQLDTWNPVHSEYELAYRLSIYHAATEALLLSQIPLSQLKVLDIGCGNGRSSRMYIELGLHPEQIIGVDVRTGGTINLAKKLNPAIQFEAYDGDPRVYSGRGINWVSLAGVLSTIKDPEGRRILANQIYELLPPGGYLFYFELYQALKMVGGGRIYPLKIFSDFEKVWARPVRSYKYVPSLFRNADYRKARRMSVIQQDLPITILSRIKRTFLPTHEVILFRKPD